MMVTMTSQLTPPTPVPLATGWEPDTPTDDTMLRRYLLHNADLTSAIARAGGGDVVKDDSFVAADLRRPSGYWNAVTLLSPPQDWEATLDSIEGIAGRGRGTVSLWSAWPTPDLRDRGWRLSGHPPLLLRPPAPVWSAPRSAGRTLARVRNEEALREWERVAIEGYPLDELMDEPPGGVAPPALLDDERFSFWSGLDGDTAVHAAMSFESRGLGSLAFGATLEPYRHRGHWRASAVRRLQSMSPPWSAGVFSDHSRAGAERLGFVPITRLTLWLLERP